MGMINKLLEKINWPSAADQEPKVLPLNNLIAKIDCEIADPLDSDKQNKKKSLNLDERQTSRQKQYILLSLEKTFFALPLVSILEVGRPPDITPLPNLPSWVLGISNIRGEIVSFINLKAFFGISSTGNSVERRFLIVHNQDIKVGIIIDRIMGILFLDQIDTDLQNSPYREGEIANYILGVAVSGERLTNILDIDKLLSSPRMAGFRQS